MSSDSDTTTSSTSDSSSSSSSQGSLFSTTSWYNSLRRRKGGRRDQVYSGRVDMPFTDDGDAAEAFSQPSAFSSSSTPSSRHTSKRDQLFAVLDRSMKQLIRQKLLLLADIVVPLIFVIITIILWAVWGTENIAETTSVSLDVLKTPLSSGYYTIDNCYHPDQAPIDNLLPCTMSPGVVCTDSAHPNVPFPAGSLCHYDEVPFFRSVLIFLFNALGNPIELPKLDTVIFYQWLALLSYDDGIRPVAEASFSGLSTNTRYSAIMCSGFLLFVGERTVTQRLVDYFRAQSKYFPHVYKEDGIYASVSQARAALLPNERLWAIVEIKSMTADNFDVVLHMNNSALPSFGETVDPAYPGGTQFDTSELYIVSGFSTLQSMVSEFYLSEIVKANLQVTHFMSAVGSPPFERVPILGDARPVLPLILTLMFLYTVSQHTRRIVLERELKLEEAMLIMGVPQWSLYLSDFLVQTLMLFIISIISTILLRCTYITKSNPMILFLVLFVYAMTTIPLSGMIATFFSKSRLATVVAPVIFFILVIPMFAMTNASGGVVTGFAFLSPSAFASCLNVLLSHEAGIGFHAEHFTSKSDNPNLALIVGIMAADFFIYYIVMLYLDAILPKEWGTAKHPLFFIIDPIKWCCGREGSGEHSIVHDPSGNGLFEDVDHSADVVQIVGLRKTYRRGGERFAAVENLYWGMREGEISVLLGHNGAGKTTVINMMTGMIKPNEGDCYVYGLSARTQCALVRQEIGFCPQHNILWPELTCRDHLEFYARVKGLKGLELENAVCQRLYETGLIDKMDAPASTLSGGQKRKLSIAIAFVGGSRLVFLDEPTAGLDVGARRHVWELLKQMAVSRTIMLTTHYMDEADLLGHRIGILSCGNLKCSGSSLFLKSRLGLGYSLTVSMDPGMPVSAVDGLVRGSVTDSEVLAHNGLELSYRLPSRHASQFPALLNSIEEQGIGVGIRGYSLSATTMEEVFLRVTEEDFGSRHETEHAEAVGVVWENTGGEGRLLSQFAATLVKRLWNALRDRRMQCFQIVCPVVCILVAMLLNLVKFNVPQEMEMSYGMFQDDGQITMLTANCDQLWGSSPVMPGVTIQETYVADIVNLSNYMLDDWYRHTDHRYGGISCIDRSTYAAYVSQIEMKNPIYHLYNTSSRHQAGLSLATFYELFLQFFAGTTKHMKVTARLFESQLMPDSITFIFSGALIMIPFTFLPSNPVAWVVKERECGARHLQNIAGLNYYVYWVANFIFDIVAYLVSMLLCIAIFAIFNRREFIALDRVGGTFALLTTFGFTSTTAAYALSFLFNEHATAQTVVMAASFAAGFLMLMIVFVLQLRENSKDASDTLRWIFRLVPTFCVGEGIINLLMLDANRVVGVASSVWDMQQLGWPLVYLAAEFPVYVVLTLIFDNPRLRRWWRRLSYDRDAEPEVGSDEDSDVEDEREAVYEAERSEDGSDAVRVVDLQKRYPNGTLAVRGITFSIFPGEVLGLLGTNGAGKTTALAMLSHQLMPSGGSASVCGHDIVSEAESAEACIGYCPQFDGTLDLLSVAQHLQLYGGIRGIGSSDCESVVSALLRLFELEEYRDVLASALSGGNRRKLSLAVALVGGPEVLLLDEPSAGLDPLARRGMWTAIQCASKHCAVVLTTHHLEEVEALADTVAIMVDGELRCIGDKIHLKNKFGTGFEVSIRVPQESLIDNVKEFIYAAFPGATLSEADDRRCVFQLPRGLAFGSIFRKLQDYKESLQISDYSVSQTSIEQIFLHVSED